MDEEFDVAIVGATIVDVTQAGRSTHDRPGSIVVVRNGIVTAIGDRGKVKLPRGVRVIFSMPPLV